MRKRAKEEGLIIAAARQPLAAGLNQDIGGLASGPVDWGYILRTGGRHGVLPMLFQAINNANAKDRVPAAVYDQLQKIYFSSLLNNRHLYQKLAPLLDAFGSHSVPILLLKGAALCLTTYTDMALRQLGDIDILVPREKVKLCQNLMEDLGFSLILNNYFPIPDDRNDELGCEWSYRMDGTVIELHWRLINTLAPFQVDTSLYWQGARQVEIEGLPALIMNPDNQLLHLCLHQFKHLWGHVRDLTDIALFLEHYRDELDWVYIASEAKSQGLERCVYYSVALANQILGDDDSAALALGQLGYRPGKIASGVQSLIAENMLEKNLPRRLWELILVDGNWNRLRLAAHALAHPFPRSEEGGMAASDSSIGNKSHTGKALAAFRTAFYYRRLLFRFSRHLLRDIKKAR